MTSRDHSPLFDAADASDETEAERLAQEGISRAVRGREHLVLFARSVALRIARERGAVTMDDVFAQLPAEISSSLGNSAGQIFRSPDFEQTGSFIKSRRASTHGRAIRIWRLRLHESVRPMQRPEPVHEMQVLATAVTPSLGFARRKVMP